MNTFGHRLVRSLLLVSVSALLCFTTTSVETAHPNMSTGVTLSIKSLEKLHKILALQDSDYLVIISPDTRLSSYLSTASKSMSCHIDCRTRSAITAEELPATTTIIVTLDATQDDDKSLLALTKRLKEGVRIFLPYEIESALLPYMLKAIHALSLSNSNDLLLYEYEIRYPSLEEQLTSLYAGVDGSCISQADAQCIRDAGGDPVYGEITFASAKKLFTEIVPLGPNDVFYDLGSGIGKLILWAYLGTDVRSCVGIELSEKRYTISEQMKKKTLATIDPISKRNAGKRTIAFKHADIGEAPIEDATVIFVCATCFSDAFLQKLTDRFGKLKPDTRIISLKKLPPHASIEEIAVHNLRMTWACDPVYIYKVVPPYNTKHVQ